MQGRRGGTTLRQPFLVGQHTKQTNIRVEVRCCSNKCSNLLRLLQGFRLSIHAAPGHSVWTGHLEAQADNTVSWELRAGSWELRAGSWETWSVSTVVLQICATPAVELIGLRGTFSSSTSTASVRHSLHKTQVQNSSSNSSCLQ